MTATNLLNILVRRIVQCTSVKTYWYSGPYLTQFQINVLWGQVLTYHSARRNNLVVFLQAYNIISLKYSVEFKDSFLANTATPVVNDSIIYTIASMFIGQVVDPFTFDKPYVSTPQLNVLSPVTIKEVMKLLRTMPSKLSPVDSVLTSVLERCSSAFAPLIARLTNLSFIEGRFLAQFKQVQMTPLLKNFGMDVDDPVSCRPISNLNMIGI